MAGRTWTGPLSPAPAESPKARLGGEYEFRLRHRLASPRFRNHCAVSQPQHEAEIESYGQQHFHRYQYLQQRKANDFTGIEQAGVSLDEESGER